MFSSIISIIDIDNVSDIYNRKQFNRHVSFDLLSLIIIFRQLLALSPPVPFQFPLTKKQSNSIPVVSSAGEFQLVFLR